MADVEHCILQTPARIAVEEAKAARVAAKAEEAARVAAEAEEAATLHASNGLSNSTVEDYVLQTLALPYECMRLVLLHATVEEHLGPGCFQVVFRLSTGYSRLFQVILGYPGSLAWDEDNISLVRRVSLI